VFDCFSSFIAASMKQTGITQSMDLSRRYSCYTSVHWVPPRPPAGGDPQHLARRSSLSLSTAAEEINLLIKLSITPPVLTSVYKIGGVNRTLQVARAYVADRQSTDPTLHRPFIRPSDSSWEAAVVVCFSRPNLNGFWAQKRYSCSCSCLHSFVRRHSRGHAFLPSETPITNATS